MHSKMKALLILFIVAILGQHTLWAADHSLKDLKIIALNWMQKTAVFRDKPLYHPQDSVMNIYLNSQSDSIIAFVIPLKPQGFIVISNDEQLHPIWAYASEGTFIDRESDQNILLNLLRSDFKLQKQAIKEGKVSAKRYQKFWQELSDSTSLALYKQVEAATVFGPHLSSKWGQGSVWNRELYEYERVFNRYTPNYWPVGCVATAMAQMLNYYQWPVNGMGSHSYTEDDAGTLSANFAETYYDWPNMLDDYGAQVTTVTEKNAAGLLSYHCAVSLNMDFEQDGSTSSTSDVPYALSNYFRFTGHYETPSGYSSFYSRLRTNMENGRVDIIALKDDSNNGHTVNVDGYDSGTGYYHLNMGWLGSSNGWYNLQGSFNAGGYTSVTGCVFDMFPEPQIQPIQINEEEPTTFTVRWKVSPRLNADYFELQQKKGSSGSWVTLSSTITDTFYVVTVDEEYTYYYRVRAHVDGYWWADSYSQVQSVRLIQAGDYRTQKSGNWNDASIWQRYNGSTWVTATNAPTSSDGQIKIKTGHTVTVTSNVTVDQVVIEENASVIIADGVDFSVNNGSGTDLKVYGRLRKEGSARILYKGSGTTTSHFYNGSRFQLAGTNKYILVATWDDSSTIEILGAIGGDMTDTYHTDQEFGNFIWDCPSQTSNVYFSGNLTKIDGSFELKNSNGYEVRLTGTAGDDPTITVKGDIKISGGILNLTSGDNNVYLVCYGNFEQSGGVIKATGDGTGNLRFGALSKGGYQGTFTYTGGTFTPEKIRINNTYTLVLNTDMNIGSATLDVNGVLVCGTHVVSGSGQFNLNAEGRIKSGHPLGLNGNITVAHRTFSISADYEFNGLTDQVTGSYLPASLQDGLIIASEGDVTLSHSTKLSGGNTGLILRQGRLITSADSLFTLANDGGWWGGSDQSFVCGPIAKERASTNPFTFPTGKGSRFRRCRIIPANSSEVTIKVEYFDQPFSDTSSLESGLQSVSEQEYWTYERTNGTTDVQVGLYWEEEGEISGISSVTVARWSGTQWEDQGEVTVEGDNASGRVTTNTALNSFGTFTFGEKKPSSMVKEAISPHIFQLYQNYPNPFNSQTTIVFDLPKSEKVQLFIFNILGQQVLKLQREHVKSGRHQFIIDMNNFASGLYFYQLKAGKYSAIKKLLLVK